MGRRSGETGGRHSIRCWLMEAAILICVTGCGSDSSSSPSALPKANSTAERGSSRAGTEASRDAALVSHPEYANWSKFPVGTSVVRKKEVSNELGVVRVTTTLRLKERTAEKVTVESQVTVDRVGHPLIENPPQPLIFPASFRVPAGMTAEQFSLPSLKAKAADEETLSVTGKEYPAEVFTWQERNETGPMQVKYWRSDSVPGRMLRQEIMGHMHNSVEAVVEISAPRDEPS